MTLNCFIFNYLKESVNERCVRILGTFIQRRYRHIGI